MTTPPHNRERYAWLLSIVLVGVLAFQVPGTLAERDTDRAFARTLLTVHRLVESNYVDPVDNKRLSAAGIDGMLQQLDQYSVYIPPAEKTAFEDTIGGQFHGGVGVLLAPRNDGVIEVSTPIENSPAWHGGVLPGDIILRVDGNPVAGKPLKDVTDSIRGEGGTTVTLGVRHAAGAEQDIPLVRGTIGLPMVKGVRRKSDQAWDYWLSEKPKLAYVRLDQFTEATADQIRGVCEQLVRDGLQGLVLDLRSNPGGRVDQAIKIVDLFVRSGTIVSTRGAHRPEQRVMAVDEDDLPDFPMVVLINEQSASASELTAGSLKDNRRATIVGARSFGKGTAQDVIDLGPDGGILKLTVAHYYLPSGRLVHRSKESTDWGVVPDIDVPMNEQQRIRLALAQQEADKMFMPGPATTATRPATSPAPPIDLQLDKAVDTLAALVALKKP